MIRTYALLIAANLLVSAASAQETFRFQHENVLGTSCELRFKADSPAAADRAEAAALAEIDRLAAIFSTYDPNSEFSRWQVEATEPTAVSRELLEVLLASERWMAATNHAFHPGAELLSRRWKAAAAESKLPTDDELHELAEQLKLPPWKLDVAGQKASRVATYPLSLNAIAKSYILELACQQAMAQAGIRGAMVKIGGDLQLLGELDQLIALRDPRDLSDNFTPVVQLRLSKVGMATSGNYFRGEQIAGQHYSHILDPRTGRSAEHAKSVTVIAPSATDADALATACSVLAISESLALIDSLTGAACLIIDSQDNTHKSSRWKSLAEPRAQLALATPLADAEAADDAAAKDNSAPATRSAEAAASATALYEMVVEFEINQPGGARYRRPYLAVWLEDEAGAPVRTISLWTLKTNQRWLPELRRWSRNDRTRRQGGDKLDLMATVAEATRRPGTYQVKWDGNDNQGKPLPAGKYVLYIESTREHGPYQLIKQDLTFAGQPFKLTLEGNTEIKAASVDYHAHKADTEKAASPATSD